MEKNTEMIFRKDGVEVSYDIETPFGEDRIAQEINYEDLRNNLTDVMMPCIIKDIQPIIEEGVLKELTFKIGFFDEYNEETEGEISGGNRGGCPPIYSKMRINDDSYEIRFANEILVNTANWLIERKKLKKSDCPIPSGRTRYLINLEPKHKRGDGFISPKALCNGTYIEVNLSARGCILAAQQQLLKKFGDPGDILKVG